MDADPKTAIDAYWVETPWRSWGVVYGATPEQARENAILDREQEIRRVEAWIECVKRMPIDIHSEEGITNEQ